MPENAIGGWRADVVAAVKAMQPGIIRFGGSALDDPNLGDFEWRDTIGDPDRRRPFRAWGGLQPTGPGLEEFVQFCRLVDAEPLICVRVTAAAPGRGRASPVLQRRRRHADGCPASQERPSPSPIACVTGKSATSGAAPITNSACPPSARP